MTRKLKCSAQTGVRMPRGRNQAQYYNQCAAVDIAPHLQRRNCFPDDFDKLGVNCGMPVNDFKSPRLTPDPPPPPPPPPPPKKKRRTSNTTSNSSSNSQSSNHAMNLLPPPLTGYGDTIVASNPFDDMPPATQSPMLSRNNNHMMNHMSGPPTSRMPPLGACSASMMNSCQMSPSNMNCSQMGNSVNCNLPPMMGGCTPMGSPVGGMHCGVMTTSRNPVAMCMPPVNNNNNNNNNSNNNNCNNINGNNNSNNNPNCGPVPVMHRNSSSSLAGSPLSVSSMGSNSNTNARTPGSPMLDCMLGMNPNSNGLQQPKPNNSHSSAVNNLNCASPIASPISSALASCNSTNVANVARSPMGPVVSGSMATDTELTMNNLNAIYPSDKSKVFNRQNPNAPPIYPCGICHKEVHDNGQAVLCESGCNFWFHRTCSGLSDAAYQLLTAEVYAEWVCDKCLSSKSIPLVKFKP